MSSLHISTAGPRLVHAECALAIRDPCQTQSVPFFKQWGGVYKKAAGRVGDEYPAARVCRVTR